MVEKFGNPWMDLKHQKQPKSSDLWTQGGGNTVNHLKMPGEIFMLLNPPPLCLDVPSQMNLVSSEMDQNWLNNMQVKWPGQFESTPYPLPNAPRNTQIGSKLNEN
ncbi:hypothetical protein B0H14DRAFT_2561980 [Mycena olivaceomarginata]|nr:hypothetical protein B0H14DRAFT_2561980 [Mycena olivaceomarginata]